MSVDMSSGRRTDLLFPPRSRNSFDSNGHGPDDQSLFPFASASASASASSPFPPSSPFSSSSSTPFPTSESASSLVSSTSTSTSLYPSSSLDHTPALSPSSSSNSVAADASIVSVASVASFASIISVATPDSSLSFSSPPPPIPSRELDLARRSSGRPLPLSLKTTGHDGSNSNNSNSSRQFAPRTSSLSTLPSIAAISTTTNLGAIERRSQSLASNNHAVASSFSPSFSPTQSARNSSASALSVVTAGPIKRKPLASNNTVAASPLAVQQRAPSPAASLAESPTAESEYAVDDYLGEEYDEHSEHSEHDEHSSHNDQIDQDDRFAFDLDGELDINIDDFLPTPDQRFTRSGSVDSPTLYEFPKTAALFSTSSALTPSSLSKEPVHAHSPSSSVEEVAQESSAVFPDTESTDSRDSVIDAVVDSVDAVAAGASSIRNSSTNTPATPQTEPTTVSPQHEQDLTTATLGSSDQILAEQPFYEGENTSNQEQESAEEPAQESDDPEEEFAKSEKSDESEQVEAPDLKVPQPEQEELNITQRNSTMSLFTRKTSPPHLSLGSISNNNTTNSNNHSTALSDNKEDNAQRSVSHDNRNSLYSIYDDEELQGTNIPIGLPTISTSPVHSDSPNNNTPNSETVNTIITTSDADSPSTLRPNNKSPSSFKLGNFFGWPSASPSSTEFSDQGFSPLPSPSSPSSLQPPPSTTFTHASTLSTPGTNSPSQQQDGFSSFGGHSKNRNLLGIISSSTKTTNTAGDESSSTNYYDDYLQNLQTPPIISPGARTASPTSPLSVSFQIEEMEDELKAISAELAGSIRREMDLEDLVDRLQTEVNNPQPPSKRTSDYFSDSGAISTKFGDYDAAKEEIAQVQRRAEQEKAQIRLELTEKLTDERSRRRVLDQQIKELSERASGLDLDARNNSDATGRVKQLESTCEDLRRRLSEERGVKENFEDLLSAMKTELQNASNERDNLRDEVVPQLRARVEGLESQAAEHARQIYETTKMQQELQSLKDENSTLRSAALSAENSAPPTPALSSNNSNNNSLSTLSRSNTVKGQPSGPPSSTANVATTNESREALAERLKDVEAQRDALHSALKSLLERQEFQNRENDKKIRVLEMERQRLLTASPKKAGYERDVAGLRDEVSVLRRRAEEALEQKWQVEKGLSGLKMDLDRAEEEIASLRGLLHQRDILLPPSSGSSRSGSNTSSVYDTDGTGATSLSSRSQPQLQAVTSASLEIAYKDLQKSYADALNRIRALESSSGTPGSVIPSDEKTTLALERLERSLTSTIAERDAARDEVATHMSRLADSAGSEKTMLENERSLAEQLDASARRVEELAQQVRTQLETNTKLRDRLAQMVSRGEADQQTHKNRITGLESRLRTLEEQLVATQTAAEDRVARHEEQIAALKEAHSTQLQRLRDASGGIRAASSPNRTPVTSPRMLSSSQFGGLGSLGGIGGAIRSPMSPMFSVNGKLVPPATSSSRPSSRGSAMSGGAASDSASATAAAAEQQAQVATLKARVGELETALASADTEMQEVVGRMNTAQIEVMQLQEELEEASRETRRLQRMLEEEKVKGFEERFKMLSRTTTV
ncbi:hypothetical protein SBRCBS47491_007199 [Sporothrix bragantina]|uniref:DUF7603 domain-containing protein n=1 Tax=Sporothrix bragantina TaxID=671064 RepID=A0ABP0CBM1_9PEZI